MSSAPDPTTSERSAVSRRQVLRTAVGGGAVLHGARATASAAEAAVDANTIYVDPDGDADADGPSEEPVATIQEGLDRAEPGQRVLANPGEYHESIRPPQGGTADAPIEITGPPEAVLRRDSDVEGAVLITDSHIHLTGLSITGLDNPEQENDADDFNDGPLINVATEDPRDDRLENVVIAPHQLGESGAELVRMLNTHNAEIGPFEVVGPAGANWLSDRTGPFNGAIVSLGADPALIEQADDIDSWDRTREIHVHHIDNRAQQPHTSLVETYPGTENITVEYCTSGGSRNTDEEIKSEIELGGYQSTVRWCTLRDGDGAGIRVGSSHAEEPATDRQSRAGTQNEIYGNDIEGFEQSISFPFDRQGQNAQAAVCGNTVDDDSPVTDTCQADLPTSEEIGVEGGDDEIETDNPNDYTPADSSANLTLYGATAASVGALFVPALIRRFRRA